MNVCGHLRYNQVSSQAYSLPYLTLSFTWAIFLSEQTETQRDLVCIPRETANLEIQTQAAFTVLMVFQFTSP